MTHQLVRNVQPDSREFVTQLDGRQSQSSATVNRGHPPTIDSRHLSGPVAPAPTPHAVSGPAFERLARAHMGLVDVYATQIANQLAASGGLDGSLLAEGLKKLPLDRLQAIVLTLPPQTNAKPVAAQPVPTVNGAPSTQLRALFYPR